MKPWLLLPLAWAAVLPTPLLGLDFSTLNDPDRLVVRTARYEARIDPATGALLALTDGRAGQAMVSAGTGEGQLWVAHFQGREDARSADYGLGGVAWTWEEPDRRLVFRYAAGPDGRPAAQAEYLFSDAGWLDLRLTLENRTGFRLRGVELPNRLRLPGAALESAALPVLPGIRFNRQFFARRQAWRHGHYPRALVFADYAQFRMGKASLATYPVSERDLTQVASRELYPEGEDYVWRHCFELAEPDGQTWTSPRLRLRVGETYADAARAFRADTGLEGQPGLRQKLGARYARLAGALSTKVDAFWMYNDFKLKLSDRAGFEKVWRGLPSPALLFVVGWSRRGFDESNPDIFPVDPRLGTDAEWKLAFGQAQAAGHLVMPYVNHTFWDDESETVQSLNPKDFAAYMENGEPLFERYGDASNPHAGYATCPYAPATQERIARLFAELKEKMPVDLVWQDQIGARFRLDYNPHVPNPLWHAQGWLEQTRRYQDLGLMTEFGYDRMIETHVGFQGNYILAEQQHWGDFGPKDWGGDDTWEFFPLASLMARDKVFFYNAPDNECISKRVLLWSLAMGQMLSYHLLPHVYRTPWHFTADAFQRHVIAPGADEVLVDFTTVTSGVTLSRFAGHQVLANWSPDRTLAAQGHVLAPEGMLVTRDDGHLTAGVFRGFKGQELSAGDHFLIIQNQPGRIIVRQPQGADTPLSLDLPSGVKQAKVTALTIGGSPPVSARIQGGRITFQWQRHLRGQEVTAYQVSWGAGDR